MMHIYTLFIHVGNSPTLPNKTTIYAAFSQCPGSCHSSKVEVLRGVRVRSLHHLPKSLANVTFFPNDSLFLLSNTTPKKEVSGISQQGFQMIQVQNPSKKSRPKTKSQTTWRTIPAIYPPPSRHKSWISSLFRWGRWTERSL